MQVLGGEWRGAGGGGGAEKAGARSPQLLPEHSSLQAEDAAVAGGSGQLQWGDIDQNNTFRLFAERVCASCAFQR